MRIKSIVAGAAVALAATIGSTSAAVADGTGSDGGPVVAAPAPTFAALGTAPAEWMTKSEMGRLTASGQITQRLVRGNRLAAFANSGFNSNTLKNLGKGLFHVNANPSP